MSAKPTKSPSLPPPWFRRAFWIVHRTVYRLTRGRVGLWHPKGDKWGTMRLETIGRHSGAKRYAIVGYYEDGPNLVTMAMNGWLQPEPAWWLNLQAHPEVTVDLPGGRRSVRGRAAVGEGRARLWARWEEIDVDLPGYATLRPSETAVVVLEPVSDIR